ncbi:MAG: histidine phosphatase family protein [Beijerinckiaceae bacterium]|jgi:phosphohistidine phosphatase
MLTLILLRHAKAVPHGGDDFARELTDKGHKDAGRTGAFLLVNDLLPDLALVSPAARTRQTFEDLAVASRPIRVHYEDDLYNAGAGELRERLRHAGSKVNTLLIVGHNPGIVELALKLGRDGDIKDLEAMRARFPPSSFAIIEFRAENWEDAAASGGQLVQFVTPDDLKAGR